jgi:ribosomal protein S18 acetylase RimI-like enzyme
MRFALDESDEAQLFAHLQGADADFMPPLSSRLDLVAYASKLAVRARRTEAWEDVKLVGLVAMYADDAIGGGFITNVSILPGYQRRGLAGQLLKRTLDLASALGLPRVRLEVNADNFAARTLYSRNNFRQAMPATAGSTLFLERVLR